MDIGGIGRGLGMIGSMFGGGAGGAGGGANPLGMIGGLFGGGGAQGGQNGAGGGGGNPLGMFGNLLGGIGGLFGGGGAGGAGGIFGLLGNLLGGIGGGNAQPGGGVGNLPAMFGGLGVGGVQDGFGDDAMGDFRAMMNQGQPQGLNAGGAQAALGGMQNLFQTGFDRAPVTGGAAADGGREVARTTPTQNGRVDRETLRRAAQKAGVPQSWADSPALQRLIQKESGGRVDAKNPNSTAFGIFQFLKSTWAQHIPEVPYGTKDAFWQSVGGFRYIQQRYGSPEAALQFHNKNNWY